MSRQEAWDKLRETMKQIVSFEEQHEWSGDVTDVEWNENVNEFETQHIGLRIRFRSQVLPRFKPDPSSSHTAEHDA